MTQHPSRPLGIIANPASGKDIRRLVAHASVFDNQEKRNIIRRVVRGAIAAGADRFVYMPDSHGLAPSAFEGLEGQAHWSAVEVPGTASDLDTRRAAEAMRAAGCAAVITLGGDGTNRAVARGWRDVPLVPISTGTNNVFPYLVEGTVAGAAAGLVASGALPLADVSDQVKAIHVEVEQWGEDLALIDVVLVAQAFVGARALWEPETLRAAVLARADPAATGISAVGGLLQPTGDEEDAALFLRFGAGGGCVRGPIAPGLYRDIAVRDVRPLALGEVVDLEGPGVLAFDGERDRVLQPGQRARLRVLRDGPRVIDVRRTLTLAARAGAFRVGYGGVICRNRL
jgi:predicted polyphosphate/ATP-dependent NAD kinase